jgi:hypothetical protein
VQPVKKSQARNKFFLFAHTKFEFLEMKTDDGNYKVSE